MTRYIKSTVADQLSNALWELERPDSVRGGEDTQYLFDWITDVHEEGWLQAETDYTIQIHEAATMDKINALVQRWIDAGVVEGDYLTGLAATVSAHQASGERLNVYNQFPQYFKDASKDRAAMYAEGYLSTDPNLPPPLPAARKR